MSSDISAFPVPQAKDDGGYIRQWPEPGMTLRDWFAGQLLVGFSPNSLAEFVSDDRLEAHIKQIWRFADLMLKIRETETK